MFSGCTVLPDIKETKLGSSNQEAFPSAGKNTGVSVMSHMEVSTTISDSADISEFPLLWQMGSQWGSQKLLQGLVSHNPTLWFWLFLTQWNGHIIQRI